MIMGYALPWDEFNFGAVVGGDFEPLPTIRKRLANVLQNHNDYYPQFIKEAKSIIKCIGMYMEEKYMGLAPPDSLPFFRRLESYAAFPEILEIAIELNKRNDNE